MLKKKLRQYDKFLTIKKELNGEKNIKRQSPFNGQRVFKVFSIQNQFLGSCKWVLKKIVDMDAQRNNFIGESFENNRKIRNQKKDSRIHEEVADYIATGGEKFVNS